MDLFPVITGAQTFMITGDFPHGNEGKLPTLPDDARVITYLSNVGGLRLNNHAVNPFSPTNTFVVPPGQEVRLTPPSSGGGFHNRPQWLACGFLLPKQPKILAAALEEAKKELEDQLKAAKAEYDTKLTAIQQALKNASVEALRSSALEVLIRETTTGVVDAIPEKLAAAIRAQVDEAVAKALSNLGHG
jgi:hypothetical protein